MRVHIRNIKEFYQSEKQKHDEKIKQMEDAQAAKDAVIAAESARLRQLQLEAQEGRDAIIAARADNAEQQDQIDSLEASLGESQEHAANETRRADNANVAAQGVVAGTQGILLRMENQRRVEADQLGQFAQSLNNLATLPAAEMATQALALASSVPAAMRPGPAQRTITAGGGASSGVVITGAGL